MSAKKNERFLVGLTGKNAAGKGEIGEFLKGLGYAYRSLSDILRDEAALRGLVPSRENLIQLGQELRVADGPGVLAKRTAAIFTGGNYVIDSIRNPAEVEILKKAGTFLLIGVDAPVQVRFERAQARGRAENADTLEEFQGMENRERSDNALSQQLDHTLALADKIFMNDSAIDSLRKSVAAFLREKNFPAS